MENKKNSIPLHTAIIMDGNGRWAEKRGLPRIMGHKEGIDAVRRTVEAAPGFGIRYLTLYSFSTENWKRPREEISFLFSLMEHNLAQEMHNLHAQNVKVRFIGRVWELPLNLQKIIRKVERLTINNSGLQLAFAVNYGGRQEILDAASRMMKSRKFAGSLDEGSFRKFFYVPDLPDADLIIRTAGEKRLSNFLLWQSAYAEFYFTPVLWPDFVREDLARACADFARRKRKYGGL